MEITCAQMDVLISFYLEDDLSTSLKKKVEEHLRKCATCRAKYDIVKDMLDDLKNKFSENKTSFYQDDKQYRIFRNNLSAYIDNELPTDESIKIKKYTIKNKQARKELEDTYNIRKLMNESFIKTRLEAKQDFSKNILKQLKPDEEYYLEFHPLLKIAMAFVMTVLALSAIIVFLITFS